MTALAPAVSVPRGRAKLARTSALGTLARRRFKLTAATPRELVVPLLTPVLFALASRVPRAEEYIARVPAIAIVPWFLAGSLFPIGALPGFLTWIARVLPLTHGLALVRYGLLGDSDGLHAIWHMSDPTAMAALSL